ncbi:MAG: class II aldolase/adducin family protein [Planctomycetaceae bacterium]
MKWEDICAVDIEGKQIAGVRKRTSEVLLHLEIMKNRPDVKSVVHCHPPHATAFAVAGEPIPQCIRKLKCSWAKFQSLRMKLPATSGLPRR